MAPFPAAPSWLHLLGLFWLPTVDGGKPSMLPHNLSMVQVACVLVTQFQDAVPLKTLIGDVLSLQTCCYCMQPLLDVWKQAMARMS